MNSGAAVVIAAVGGLLVGYGGTTGGLFWIAAALGAFLIGVAMRHVGYF